MPASHTDPAPGDVVVMTADGARRLHEHLGGRLPRRHVLWLSDCCKTMPAVVSASWAGREFVVKPSELRELAQRMLTAGAPELPWQVIRPNALGRVILEGTSLAALATTP